MEIMSTLPGLVLAPLPTFSKGCVVFCRSHHHLVEEVWPPEEEGRDIEASKQLIYEA